MQACLAKTSATEQNECSVDKEANCNVLCTSIGRGMTSSSDLKGAPAYIVKGAQLLVLAPHNEVVDVSNCASEIVPWIGSLVGMAYHLQ